MSDLPASGVTRFAEYATSGAFQVSLTRAQIQSLGFVLGTGGAMYSHGASLERKGMVERIAGRPEPFGTEQAEFRLTSAGAMVLALCHMAGLSNIGGEAIPIELDALRKELDDARHAAADARLRARSMHARLSEAELELANARAEIARLKNRHRLGDALPAEEKLQVRVLPRDPLPDLSTEQVMEGFSQ